VAASLLPSLVFQEKNTNWMLCGQTLEGKIFTFLVWWCLPVVFCGPGKGRQGCPGRTRVEAAREVEQVMNSRVIAERLGEVRRRLGKRRIKFLLVTKPANVTYVTGFMGQDSWAAVTGNRTYLLTDSRYTEQARQEASGCVLVERKDSMAEAAAKLAGRLKSVRSVAVEDSICLGEFESLKKRLKRRLRAVGGIIEGVRAVKSRAEVAAIRRSASITAQALQEVLASIRPGISEIELAGLLDLQIRRAGGTNSFETIVAFGPNASRPHHQPCKRRLRRRDTVLIDFGARYKGYCSDITRCLVVGGSSSLYDRALAVVEQAQAAAIEAVRPGAKLDEVDTAARRVIGEAGLPIYGHGTGHGIGLEIHERPFLKAGAGGRLSAGQVVTIEPGIYIPGKLGVRIEDDVLVTESGSQVLTAGCPHRLVVPGG